MLVELLVDASERPPSVERFGHTTNDCEPLKEIQSRSRDGYGDEESRIHPHGSEDRKNDHGDCTNRKHSHARPFAFTKSARVSNRLLPIKHRCRRGRPVHVRIRGMLRQDTCFAFTRYRRRGEPHCTSLCAGRTCVVDDERRTVGATENKRVIRLNSFTCGASFHRARV